MNSASHPHATQHHHHAHQLVFGQLPPTTYEAAAAAALAPPPPPPPTSAPPPSAPITVDTSTPSAGPLNFNYQINGGGGPPAVGGRGNTGGSGGGRRGPGSIKWNEEGVSTSAERRLPFVHRFRPVDLPPPAGLVTASGQPVTANGHQQQPTYSHAGITGGVPGPIGGQLGPHINKALNKMSLYETNPVGALQERFQSMGVLPSYRVIQFEGMSHNPVFTFEVTIGDKTAMGSGNSKKQAKHAAARALLDKFDNRVSEVQPFNKNPPMGPVANPQAVGGESNNGNGNQGGTVSADGSTNGNGQASLPSNPIGSIQEYCVKFSLPLPIYDLQNTSGQPHQRNFDIIAKVGNIASGGQGTSKKDAKRAAATALLEKLKALGTDVANAAGSSTAANGNGNGANLGELDEELMNKVADMKVDILTPKHSKVLKDFYLKIQDSRKAKLLALHQTSLRNPKLDCVQLLAELGQEQNFDVTYVDIEERTAVGEIQCLVQLSTMPVAVCHGTGQDQTAANNCAARNALEYLKIMVKKSNPGGQPAAAGANKNDEKPNKDQEVKPIKPPQQKNGTKKGK